MTVLTDEQQAFTRSIRVTGMTTDRACLARIMGIHLNRHTAMQQGFVGNHTLQFSKRPFGVGGIGFALFARGGFATLPAVPPEWGVLFLTPLVPSVCPRAFANVCQILQADQAMRVRVRDACGDRMIGVGFQPPIRGAQPSLSSADRHQATGRGTSAFLLQTLPQSRVMIGFWHHLFARVESTLSPVVAVTDR